MPRRELLATCASKAMCTKTSTERIEAAISASLKRLDFRELRKSQELALHRFIEGNDVFVSLPTGSGKSLCYWMLPAAFNALRDRADSIVIVVSPLKDQVQSLTARSVKAIYVGDADDSTVEKITQGEYEILFFSPENLLTNVDWRDVLQSPIFQERLVAFVVDEAHCVKDW